MPATGSDISASASVASVESGGEKMIAGVGSASSGTGESSARSASCGASLGMAVHWLPALLLLPPLSASLTEEPRQEHMAEQPAKGVALRAYCVAAIKACHK